MPRMWFRPNSNCAQNVLNAQKSPDHFKTFILGKSFSIWATVGPKSASEVEWPISISKSHSKSAPKSWKKLRKCYWFILCFRPDIMGRNTHSRYFKISFRPTLKASITHFGPFCIAKHVGRNERCLKSDKITNMCKIAFLEADWICLECDFGPTQIAFIMF